MKDTLLRKVIRIGVPFFLFIFWVFVFGPPEWADFHGSYVTGSLRQNLARGHAAHNRASPPWVFTPNSQTNAQMNYSGWIRPRPGYTDPKTIRLDYRGCLKEVMLGENSLLNQRPTLTTEYAAFCELEHSEIFQIPKLSSETRLSIVIQTPANANLSGSIDATFGTLLYRVIYSIVFSLLVLAMAWGWVSEAKPRFPGAPISLRRRALWALFLLIAFLTRYAFVFLDHPPENAIISDMGGYYHHATQFLTRTLDPYISLQGSGFPFFLSIAFRLTPGSFDGAKWMHVFLGFWTVVIAWRAVARGWGERIAQWALPLFAIHNSWIFLSGFFMAETLFTFLLSILIYLMMTRLGSGKFSMARGVLFGVVWLVADNTKGTLTVMFAMLITSTAIRLWRKHRNSSQPAPFADPEFLGFSSAVATYAIGAVLLYGVTATLYNRPLVGGAGAGLNLTIGKCRTTWVQDPGGYAFGIAPYLDPNPPLNYFSKSYFWDNWGLLREGGSCLYEHPLRLLTDLTYGAYLFADNRMFPNSAGYYPYSKEWIEAEDVSRRLYLLLALPGIVAALLNRSRHPWRRNQWVFCAIAGLLFTAWTSRIEIRYRYPFDILFIPLAIEGWRLLWTRIYLQKKRTLKPQLDT